MKRLLLLFTTGAVVFLLCPVPDVWAAQNKHEERVLAYTGTQSCTICHKTAAPEVAASLHYLQLQEPKSLTNWPKGKLAGMMDTY